MGQITVRQLDDHLIQTLRERAAAHGHSMEQEARRILTEALSADRSAVADRFRRRQQCYGPRQFSDSADLIRQMRDDRSDDLADRQ